MHKLLIMVLILASIAVAQLPVAELPRVYIDTTWKGPVGVTWPAHSSAGFRNALKFAQPGDTIVLDASVVYSGNFSLPAKNNPGRKWIYIVSSALSKLPAPGTRVSPADAVNMPKIVTPNASNAFTIGNGSGYVRFAGIEMYSTSTNGANPANTPWPINGFAYYLVGINNAPHVTVDRCYLHGSPTEDVNHAIGAYSGASYIAVVDSYISDIHGWTNDSQAFLAFAAPGPFKLVNNLLSASSEDVMFGGAGGYANPYVPSDIEIRNNHFWKDPAWEPMTSGTQPWQWAIKNNLECKSCLRMLVVGNVMENAWYGSDQVGVNITLTPRTNSSGYNTVDDDITIQHNVLKNANQGIQMAGYDNNCIAPACIIVGETKRVVIRDNFILTRDSADVGSYHPLGFLMGHRMDAVLIQHNTLQGINGTQSWASFYFCDAVSTDHPTNVWILDNVLSRQPSGDGGFQGQKALDTYIPVPAPDGSRFLGNVMFVPAADKVQTWPLHNYATTVPVTLVNVASGNYQLATPTWTDTSDGKIAGVDF